jgi:(4S)-4-hydroxy-5-phosphonooxypentane-2,3-dione isomerase
MNGQISWHVELAIKPGQLKSFLALTGEMVASARREHGVLSYQRFVSEDGKTIHIYERYADCAAALMHLKTFAKTFAEQFQSMVERKRFVVLGYPTADLKAALDELGAIYFKLFGDFAYWA